MRFDLRAEVELPSPSARVTHQGCVEEADPEGLKPQLGRGRGVELMASRGRGEERQNRPRETQGTGVGLGAGLSSEGPFPSTVPVPKIPLAGWGARHRIPGLS